MSKGDRCLSVENLTVKRGTRVVLKGITLSFNCPGFVGIVGPGGSGKTTLGMVLSGLLDTYEGVIVGPDGHPPRPGEILYVFQQPEEQFFTGSVLEELVVSFTLDGLPVDVATGKATAILDRLGLGPFAPVQPSRLSGGMKQVLAVATAVFRESAKVIIFDEVLSMLDPRTARLVIGLMWEFSRRGLAVMITHGEEHLKWVERVIGIVEGSIAYDGLPEDLWRSGERFVAKFGLRIPRTFQIAQESGLPWRPLGLIGLK